MSETARVPKAQLERYQRVAKKYGFTVTYLVQRALEAFDVEGIGHALSKTSLGQPRKDGEK